jgi:5'-methylthioadenosine phosphorylase
MADKLLGVIGGSGLYQMKGLDVIEKVKVDTPFGSPSANHT